MRSAKIALKAVKEIPLASDFGEIAGNLASKIILAFYFFQPFLSRDWGNFIGVEKTGENCLLVFIVRVKKNFFRDFTRKRLGIGGVTSN